MMRKNVSKDRLPISKIMTIIFLGLFLVILLFSIFSKGSDELIIADFEVKKGQSTWEIARELEKKNLIDDKISFIFYVYKEGAHKEIKAGEYKFNSGLSNQEIVDMLTSGEIIEEEVSIKTTFPEGWSSRQMAARLKENNFSDEEFLKLVKSPENFAGDHPFLSDIPKGKNLEGYLFPDTYFFNPELEDEEAVIEKMLKNFDEKLSIDLRSEINKQNKTIYEIITMASILEKEVRTQADRKIVSGIFWNRLESGQAFQSCATLAFILGENKKQYSYEDTRIQSLYNTYLYPGLPPGPISNPGIDAINAAIYPVETNYNYFLSNPETGETVFSRTLDEHNINKVKNGL